MLGKLLLAVAAAIALPVPALACSMSDWNSYESYWEGDLSRLVREAATIDWVDVRVTGAQRCPSWGDLEAASGGSSVAKIPAGCDAFDMPVAGLFEAGVVERLKGTSPRTFDLFMLTPRQTDYLGKIHNPEKFGFSDLRRLHPDLAWSFRRREAMTAASGHHSLGFWSRSVSQFSLDGEDSCGGRRSLDPLQRYVVFRSSAGEVTALEPVSREDDLLLERLRRIRDGVLSDIRSEIAIADYFRRARNLVLAHVSVCLDSDYSDREIGWLAIDRGDPAFLQQERPKGAPPQDVFLFKELPDFFAFRKEPCPFGHKILVLSFDTTEYGPLFYLRMIVDGLPAPVAYMAGLADYSTLMSIYDYSLDTPIRVSDGNTVKLSDIQTGLTLIGPESVSVDDIFRWQEEGRAARKWR